MSSIPTQHLILSDSVTRSPLSPPRNHGAVMAGLLMLIVAGLPIAVAFVLGLLATN